MCDDAGVYTEGSEIRKKGGNRIERRGDCRMYVIFNMIRRGQDAHWGTLKGIRLM